MLEYAVKYRYELEEKFLSCMEKEKYKYFFITSNTNEPFMLGTDKDDHQFVSINSNGDVLGFIGWFGNRELSKASVYQAINFGDTNMTFGVDLGKCIDDIFRKYNYELLTFCVHKGNPAEEMYDKYIKKYGGSITGISERSVILYDGTITDMKSYEIRKEDYLNSKLKTVKERSNNYKVKLYNSLKNLHPEVKQINSIIQKIIDYMWKEYRDKNKDVSVDVDPYEFLSKTFGLSEEEDEDICLFMESEFIERNERLKKEIRRLD